MAPLAATLLSTSRKPSIRKGRRLFVVSGVLKSELLRGRVCAPVVIPTWKGDLAIAIDKAVRFEFEALQRYGSTRLLLVDWLAAMLASKKGAGFARHRRAG